MPSRLVLAVRRWTRALVPSGPQLLMHYPGRNSPVQIDIPKSYQVRSYRDGDISGWVSLLSANGELGPWDEGRAREAFEAVAAGMQFFVLFEGHQIVACSSVNDKVIEGEQVWEIGWIATHPQHQRKGLGSHATTVAVQAALTLAPRDIVLRTDDYRLPAIRTYLKLGFVPTCGHPTYGDRWNKVFVQLGDEYQHHNPASLAKAHR